MLSSRNRSLVFLALVVASLWLSGCDALNAPATPTLAFATRTLTPTITPTFTRTALPTSTNTLVPTATHTPTITPTPTRLPLPTAAPPPGWKKLESANIELWVPGSFVGGDPVKDKDALLKALRAFGSEYVASFKSVEQNPNAFAIYAIDTRLGSTGFITTITLTVNQIVGSGTQETLRGGATLQFPRQYTVLDRRNVALYYAAERMVTDSVVQNIRMRQLVYTIKSTNTAWVLAFSTTEDEFFSRL
ncbi:MAG: hypothetical protein L0Y55_04295, partial [Anaerolineales bacterium]|nr:hypothetical protein [Anaerolineales bacterium]